MTTHTHNGASEWAHSLDTDGLGASIVSRRDGYIAHVQWRENAPLIAAAPALLAVCLAIRDRYNTDDRMGGLGDWLSDAITQALAPCQTSQT